MHATTADVPSMAGHIHCRLTRRAQFDEPVTACCHVHFGNTANHKDVLMQLRW